MMLVAEMALIQTQSLPFGNRCIHASAPQYELDPYAAVKDADSRTH